MSVKKLVIAMVVCFIVLMGTNWFIHQFWLMNDYLATPDSWRPMADLNHRMWVMMVGQAFFAVLFCYIYSRGAEAKGWIGQGIRYGILITMFFVIPTALSEFTVFKVPHMLAVKWMIAGCIQMMILGLITAGICQKKTA